MDKLKGIMFTQCRVMGHVWKPVDVERDCGDFIQVLTCRFCQTQRRWRLSSTGQPKGNSYTYPDDYQQDGGLTSCEKDALRLRYVTKRASKK